MTIWMIELFQRHGKLDAVAVGILLALRRCDAAGGRGRILHQELDLIEDRAIAGLFLEGRQSPPNSRMPP